MRRSLKEDKIGNDLDEVDCEFLARSRSSSFHADPFSPVSSYRSWFDQSNDSTLDETINLQKLRIQEVDGPSSLKSCSNSEVVCTECRKLKPLSEFQPVRMDSF